MKKMRPFCRLSLLAAALLALAVPAWAGVTNEGNDAVEVLFEKNSGSSEQRGLFPGQSVVIPEGTVSVALRARGSGSRGDEKINVKIVEPSGTITHLKQYGATHRLGKQPDAAGGDTILKMGRLTNVGNINVNVAIRTSDGLSNMRELFIGQPLILSKNTIEVEVLSDKILRGDEIVKVSVLMPDGEQIEISGLGGKATLKEES